jgi:hypothetical protein
MNEQEDKERIEISDNNIFHTELDLFDPLTKYHQDYLNQLTNVLKGYDFSQIGKWGEAIGSAFSNIDAYKGVTSGVVLAAEKLQGLKLNETITHMTSSLALASSLIDSYNDSIRGVLKGLSLGLSDIFGNIDWKYKGRIMPQNVDAFKRVYWVIPYEYSQKQIDSVKGLKVSAFNKKMLRHFTDKRVKKIFNVIGRYSKEPNKKRLIKQCAKNYLDGCYALCITGLITYLDGLTLELLNTASYRQHMSYIVINSLKEAYGKTSGTDNYIKYLRICIADNFYSQFYENQTLKNNKRRKIIRSINSHGVRYTNSKIDALRIINAIKYTQEIINDVNDLKDCFKIENKSIGNGKTIPYAVLNIPTKSETIKL